MVQAKGRAGLIDGTLATDPSTPFTIAEIRHETNMTFLRQNILRYD